MHDKLKKKILLKDAFKQYTFDQDKVVSPDETVRRFKEKIKRLDLNILECTKRIDNGRLDIPVYFSVCGHDAVSVIGTKKQMGKGAAPEQAEASAVMELAERYSFFSFCKDHNNFLYEKYAAVKDNAIPFEMIAGSVHDGGNDLEMSKKIFEDLTLQWTWGYNITQDKEVLIPFNWFFSINEFNGPSAGNCAEEAISQGICEIVERHVSSLISREKRMVPAINPDSVTDRMAADMIGKYRKAGINLYLSDFSLGMGIPTVGALAYDPSTFPERSEIVWTAGTTPDPQKALSRALTEVAQLAGDFNTHANYVASGLPKYKNIKDADYICNAGQTVNLTELPDISDNNIRIEINNCVSALSAKGLDVILIDTMHPGLQIPAFYTIIPGAHFRERAQGTSVGLFSAKLISENNGPEVAMGELKNMEKLLPGKYYIKFYLGSCAIALGQYDAAEKYFQRALELTPAVEDTASIYSYLGVCRKEKGEYQQAIEALAKGEQIDNERTDIYNLKGFCYFKLKEHEKAIACFKKAIDLNPASAIDYANIASNYRDMGEKDKAIHYYTLALEIDPAIEFARENLIKLCDRE